MDTKELFEKYRKRLAIIGIFKSLLFGLIVGFSASGFSALIVWIFDCSLATTLIVSFGIGVAALIISTTVLYLLKFKPDEQMIAEKLDSLGLDERVITMCEYREKDSYVARIQRADAREKIGSISAKHIRFSVAMPIVILLIVSFVFAAGSTTVSALATANIIGHKAETDLGDNSAPNDSEEIPKEEIFTVNYLVYEIGTGHIEGETSQTVKKGGMTQAVVAVAEDGYMFYAWVDRNMRPIGVQIPERNDLNVRDNMDVYAYFVEIPEDEEGPGQQQPPDGEEGGKGQNGNQNGSNQGGNSHGNNGNTGNSGEGSEDGGDENVGDGDDYTQVAPGRENNNVIDGSQDYKDAFDREQEEKELDEDDSFPDDLKDLVGDYFDILDP